MITVPPSLNSANAALNVAESLAKLLDPKERQKIADDIKTHHALNDTEAKKAEEARSLIKKHTDVLNETHQAENRIAREKKDLEQEKANFKTEMEEERSKISILKGEAKDALEKAENLNVHAISIRDRANEKEKTLDGLKKEHDDNVKKLAQERKDIEKERIKLEAFKKEITELDSQTKAKLEALRKHNF